LETRKNEKLEKRDDAGYYRPHEEAVTERALLVGVHLIASRPGAPQHHADLDELQRLAETAGSEVVGRMDQRRQAPDARSLLGKGKAEQLKQMVETLDANLVVVDNDLTPAQGRNLEKLVGVKTIDRTELILDIFARHARTRQSRLQVGLAQYEYLLPRLAKMWSHLERQAGGIGTRGPGETQIETDRRIIRNRINQMKRDLKKIGRQMETQNKQRENIFRVALAGYTNAGKSSLMNRVSEAEVYVQDELFATLDATTRRVQTLDQHAFLLTDTVGFVRNLPHHLVESFRSTLSEVADADLLLHVVDAGDEDLEGRIEAVDGVLETMNLRDSQERWLVFNKCDTIEDVQRDGLRRLYPNALFTSAHSGEGLEELLGELDKRLRREERHMVVRVPSGNGKTLSRLYEVADVKDTVYENGAAIITLRVDRENYGRVVHLDDLTVVEVRSRG